MKRLAFFLLLSSMAFGGGPLHVAGISGFQPGLAGTPITWNNGQVSYYTDQGDLSPLLPNAVADQFVADAFSRWTSVTTAAIRADRAGALSEDVNGTNVTLINGTLTLPDDIKPASSKPVTIVYDADGKVLDALLGAGAGGIDLCSTNSVYGETDRFTDDAHAGHALVIINGVCARSSDQLPILKYRLIRVLGRILGLDYSQLNDNVISGAPPPTLEDYGGYPLMHPLGALCSDLTGCHADADQLRMDDRAALSRLYPVTASNLASFSQKQIFKDNTGRIFGSVRFPAWKGTIGQGMQGVNVVARMVDPVTSRVSRRYANSSVSGLLFRGTAGNPITGYYDTLGRPLNSMGSVDPALEGYFDLAGLEIPDGYASVTYELSVEPVNPLYADSTAVGPYQGGPVSPSGMASAVRLTVMRGGQVAHDVKMPNAAGEPQDQYEPHSFLLPWAVPDGGNWLASLSGYGDLDFMYFTSQANRTFTLDVTALDEKGLATTAKAQPVLGAWDWSDAEDSPRVRESYFNTLQTGMTRLQGSVLSTSNYKSGIADYRGDGRPDFRYEARLLYADNLTPKRASVNGGSSITVNGIGFANTMQVQVGTQKVPATVISPNQIVFNSLALPDATYSVTVTDPANGASSVMTNVLHVGSAETRITLVSGSNPQVPVGTQAPNPVRVRVVDNDTGDPVAGATVGFSVPATAAIVGCSQSLCYFVTDQNGTASAYVLVKAAGPSVLSASLPTGGSTGATINGVAAPLEIMLDNPTVYVAAGSTAGVPVSATVVANGVPASGRTVNFLKNSGTATIAPASATTNVNGIAAATVSVSSLAADVNISACVAPGNAPCRTLVIHPVAMSGMSIQRVSGDQQVINVGDSFAPVSVRVVDGNGSAVSGMPVAFLVDVYRFQNDTVRVVHGETVTFTRDEPVVLQTIAATVVTNAAGVATLALNIDQAQPVRVVVRSTAGQTTLDLQLRSMWGPDGTSSAPSFSPPVSKALNGPGRVARQTRSAESGER